MANRYCRTCRRVFAVAAAGDFCPADGTALVDAPAGADALVGMLVAGRYRVIKRLGEGGMGEVYLATHEAIEKRVALKILKHEYSDRPDVVARFQQEAKSASRIKHPNIVDVSDFGQIDDGRFFLALEYLEGHDLARELSKKRIVETERALRIAIQVCGALGAAHAKGVVHRDLKPENIFLQVDENGEDAVKIVDFGIAKMREIGEMAPEDPALEGRRLTKAGTIFGTPEYMAPEQASGRDVDHRADIYAVGILLYEMFTGRVPFSGDSLIHTLTMHVTEQPTPMRERNPALAISPHLERVVMGTLAKNPAHRPQSMAALADELLGTTDAGAISPTSKRGHGHIALAETRPASQRPPAAQPSSVPPIPLVTRARTAVPLDVRAETLAEVELPVARSRTGLMVGLAFGAVAAGAIGAFLIARFSHGSSDALAPPAPSAQPSAVVVVAEPAPTPSASASAPVVTAQAGVVLHVVTTPPGAIVRKGGFQVCDSSPCDVTAQPNEALDLTVELGDQRGQAKVLAQREQTVTIKLAKSPTATAGGTKPSASSGAGGGRNVAPTPMCEVIEGDLKILRPCK